MRYFRRFFKFMMRKLFKRERREGTEEVTAAVFLRSVAKLASEGKASVFRGGQQAFGDALMDQDRITYILTIKVAKHRRVNDQKWFDMYAEKERGRV